ncbi:hypothetical protein [Paenibacillus sedimenti]|uniref:Uncharacterized protein n=1 Tax=Paenibacillus sedimenti TaxID=2770274 RepID=A0A926KU68_9BACL|nr:hypothetical protein [Paenibacillus sedimenti]MBD0384105.1 hypothetical protein [Paenibacillus sedimenti]
MKKLFRLLIVIGTIILSTPQPVWATEGAEVFDIRKGDIVLTIPNSNLLQNQVKEWLSSASGIAGSFRIEPSDGIAIKIPLTPPCKIRNKWISGTVTEVILFIGKLDTYNPTLLVFTKENHLVAVHIKSKDLKTFLKENNLYSSDLNLGAPH